MNEQYLNRMKDMLKEEYPQFLACLEEKPERGFRVNTLKICEDDFFALTNLERSKSSFADNGYILHGQQGLGKTPEYFAGLLYMQEPSASSAVTVLNPKPGMKVLDMCAAPGSKSTQIAEKLQNDGLLVVNEINHKRASILLENIEKCGTANAIVLNSDTSQLAQTFPEYFDMVLCDAPCSGEGMMRKNEEAENQWSQDLVLQCAALQKEILENAYACLKKGGTLVYSTCTFSMEENEWMIQQFLQKHPDMHTVAIDVPFGRKAFAVDEQTARAIRIFPMDHGEGHFVCRLMKDGEEQEMDLPLMKSDAMPKFVKEFLQDNLCEQYPYYFVHADRVYGGVNPFVQVGKCKLMRHQVYLGEIKNKRFEPSHSFFLSSYAQLKSQVTLTDEECLKYLRGETLKTTMPKGWYAVQYRGYTFSGGYSDGKMLKNKFPKSLRLR